MGFITGKSKVVFQCVPFYVWMYVIIQMWFEILPAFIIIVLAMGAPHKIAPGLNYLMNGNKFKRRLATKDQRLQYLRDIRLAGNPYDVVGLDNLKDCVEPEKSKPKKTKGPPPPQAQDYCAEKREGS